MKDESEDNSKLSFEDWLYAKNIDWLQELHKLLNKVRTLLWRVLAAAFVLGIVAFGLGWQVQTRNTRLDRLEDTTADMQETVNEIRDISREFKDAAESPGNPAIAKGLERIEKLCIQFDCEAVKNG